MKMGLNDVSTNINHLSQFVDVSIRIDFQTKSRAILNGNGC